MVNTQSIVDEYDKGNNGVFSAGEVETIVKNLDKEEESTLMKSRFMLLCFMFVAAASVIDRGLARTGHQQVLITQLPSANSDHPSVRNLQSGVMTDFEGWVECDGLATVPASYVTADQMSTVDQTLYICKSTLDSFGCDTTRSPTPSDTMSPTASAPVLAPVNPPTEVSTPAPTPATTTAPTPVPTTQMPVTSSPTETGCFNIEGFAYDGDTDHDCEWIQRNPGRDNLLCSKKTEVREACPAVCGICCGDTPTFTFQSFQLAPSDCAFLTIDPSHVAQYCPVPEIKTNCPLACGLCKAYISFAPSSLGTSNETVSPTDRLDDD